MLRLHPGDYALRTTLDQQHRRSDIVQIEPRCGGCILHAAHPFGQVAASVLCRIAFIRAGTALNGLIAYGLIGAALPDCVLPQQS
jgi:hypothetical protein